jgi:hypothetical protein
MLAFDPQLSENAGMFSDLLLRDWFHFSDRDSPPMNTSAETMVLVEKFWKADFNEFSDPTWRRDEWSIHSALVASISWKPQLGWFHRLCSRIIEMHNNSLRLHKYAAEITIELMLANLCTMPGLNEDCPI